MSPLADSPPWLYRVARLDLVTAFSRVGRKSVPKRLDGHSIECGASDFIFEAKDSISASTGTPHEAHVLQTFKVEGISMTKQIRFRSLLSCLLVIVSFVVITVVQRPDKAGAQTPPPQAGGPIRPLAKRSDQAIADTALQSIEKGRETFRFDTFGDEAFWGDTLNLDATIAGAANGGIGPGLSPKQAFGLGLKVDVSALPAALQDQLRAGAINLDDPAVTVALLQLNAVVGVKGFFSNGVLNSVGIPCALCHSTVNDSFAPGIGSRLDGWANRDLNVGAIAAFGLAGVNLHTWTGWGSVTHWNSFVSNLEMHGKGTFFDPRLNDSAQFPIAAANGLGNVRTTPDLITRKLADLHFYQLAIPAPAPPNGSFNAMAAARGRAL